MIDVRNGSKKVCYVRKFERKETIIAWVPLSCSPRGNISPIHCDNTKDPLLTHSDMTDDTIEIQKSAAMNIATISAGFEKGDFLVREEQGNRVYFDFFEEVGLS